jgi:hypothetical protein
LWYGWGRYALPHQLTYTADSQLKIIEVLPEAGNVIYDYCSKIKPVFFQLGRNLLKKKSDFHKRYCIASVFSVTAF